MYDNQNKLKGVYLQCIGAILAISEREPLAVPDLQHLLLVAGRIDQPTLEQITNNLRPLLLKLPGERIRFYHHSFKYFITNSSCSGEFYIELNQYDAEPAACCLKVMQRDLRFNICKLETSHRLNSEVTDLKRRIDTHIGPALKYACTHWVDHVIAAPNQALVEAIKELFEGPQLMYWIEVLSLLGCIDIGVTGLSKLASLDLLYGTNEPEAVSTSQPPPIETWLHALFTPPKAICSHRALTMVQSENGMSQVVFKPAVCLPVTLARFICLAFSPNGWKITSGSVDKTVQIWDVATGEKSGTHTFPIKHSDTITSIAFPPNRQHIASSSLDGLMHVWDGTTSEAVFRSFGHSSPVNSITFSPDGSFIVSGSTDTTTRVWKTVRLPLVRLVGHSSFVVSVAVSSNGTRIVSGSCDNTVRIWDTQTGTQIGDPCTGHSNYVYGVAISPDGAHVVSVSNDKTIKHWDMATHTNLHSYQHSHPICCTAFSPNGALIAFGSEDNKVYVWDFAGWEMINQGMSTQSHTHPTALSLHLDPKITRFAFWPDGAYIASASEDRDVILWDVGTHSRSDVTLTGHTNCVISVAFSPCGTRLVSGSDDKTIRLWDRQTGSTTHTFTGHTYPVMSVAFSPDGDYVASGSADRTVRLWNTRTGQAIGQPFTGHSDWVQSITFSPDISYLVSGSNDRTIRAWSLEESPSLAGQAQVPPGAFCWPSNPYNLFSHPDRPVWVTHDSQSLVLWLPAYYQHREQFVGGASRRAFLDYSKFVHGMAWTEIASEPIRRNSQ
ncbi:unnamed protein product [Rhizoctonia solani]|uniref:Uncharacterized protein n=1 Tax=Rhizoctonia solani TaxID=456999 RepID=A0A8H3HPZ0_9AGAM|nr:unnamed protein product [Rhizoctonia solani]